MQRTVRKKHGGVFSAGMLAAGIFAAALSLASADRAQAQCMYEIVAEISAPPGALTLGVAAINDNNVIVGSFLTSGFTFRPYMWTAETGVVPIALPPGVSEAQALDVNNHNEIVGFLTRPGVGQRAFRYKDGVWTELPPTGGSMSSRANAINDDGWVVGYRDTDDGIVAFKWRGDAVEELSSQIRDVGARADDVNSHQAVTGTFGSLIFGRAFLWQLDQITLIPPVEGGTSSVGVAINSQSLASGYSYIKIREGDVPIRSWVFENGELGDLGTLPEANHRTTAFDINNACQIVGRSETDGSGQSVRAFLWQNGQIFNIETLFVDPPKFLWLGGAEAINNHGVIVASNQAFGGQFVLAPADRPLGDINIDCVVDERDLIAVLEGWGPDKLGHIADIVTSATVQPPGDGRVDGADLAVVLGNWSVSGSQSSHQRGK